MEEKKLYELVSTAVANLTGEQKKKAEECKNLNDLIDLLGKTGVALPDELMNAVAGGIIYQGEPGYISKTTTCKRCGNAFSYLEVWMPGCNCYEPVAPLYCQKCRLR